MHFIVLIFFALIFYTNPNRNQVFGCECPAKDNRNYVSADAGDLQANGQLKCWYVAQSGNARGTLYCLYRTDCTIAIDGDGGFCVSSTPTTIVAPTQPGSGGNTTTTTTTSSKCQCPATDTTGTALIAGQIQSGALACSYSMSDNGCWYDLNTCALIQDEHGGQCSGSQTNTTSTTNGQTTSTTMMGAMTSSTTTQMTASTSTLMMSTGSTSTSMMSTGSTSTSMISTGSASTSMMSTGSASTSTPIMSATSTSTLSMTTTTFSNASSATIVFGNTTQSAGINSGNICLRDVA
ncbi:unnamed protein product [Adineta ricciae]|uniref:Uncharacterized protein n=1 Tax=Adineta ricciae TaxID=249248 RepID=A0A815L8N6_ADIRI|nr:unnamed protein product [Adineta ricciae]CAF1487953.1 unnamed protein product [Adineta ricciae]